MKMLIFYHNAFNEDISSGLTEADDLKDFILHFLPH